jgi:hypothetical protein
LPFTVTLLMYILKMRGHEGRAMPDEPAAILSSIIDPKAMKALLACREQPVSWPSCCVRVEDAEV